MKPAVRRLLVVAAAVAALVLLALIALPYVVSLDAMRARVAARAEKALHRKVDIARVRLQIFSGLGAGVEGVVVHNKDGFLTPSLLSADTVSVKVAFWPLLSRHVEVRKIVLHGVTLTVERNADGKLNVDDFLSAGGRESPAAAETAAALLVSDVEIARGRAEFLDRKVSPGQAVTTAIEDLTGRIRDVSPTTPIRFDLAARFLAEKGRNLALQGTLGPPPAGGPMGQAPLHATFSLKDLALGKLASYAEALRSADPGSLTVSGKADGAPLGTLALAGRLALDPPAGSKSPTADGTFALTFDKPRGSLVLGETLVSVADLPLRIAGRVDGLAGDSPARLDLSVATPGEIAIDSLTALPLLSHALPEGAAVTGRVKLEATAKGTSAELETRGTLDAQPFAVAMDKKEMLTAGSAHATLARSGAGPLTGTVAIPAGKL